MESNGSGNGARYDIEHGAQNDCIVRKQSANDGTGQTAQIGGDAPHPESLRPLLLGQ